ncbi:MAG: EamA family transporter [Rhodospirillales bacterium]|nr:EamA family transporter [Rhodospirillales bacterium]
MLKLATMGGYDELTVLFVSLLLIAVFYVLILILRRGLFRLSLERFVFLVVISLLGYVLPLLAAVYASPYVPAGVMTLMVSLTPVVTVATAVLFRTEAVSLNRAMAIAMGAATVITVLLPAFEIPDGQLFGWMVLMLVVPISYGVESVYVSAYWPDGLDVIQVGTGEVVLSAVMVLPLYLIWGEAPTFEIDWGRVRSESPCLPSPA